MDETKLLMNFENSAGNKMTIKIGDVRPDITKAETDALGNHIVNKSIFSYKNANLTVYVGAQIETTHIEDL